MSLLRSTLLSFGILLLFVGNIGVNIYTHSCKEDGVSISYFVNSGEEHCANHKEKTPPCCNRSEKESDCCNDELDLVKINLDFYHTAQEFQCPIITSELISVFTTYYIAESQSKQISNYEDPPPIPSRELLIRKQVFII